MHTLPCFFFFNDTATTEIYTLSLHDALPISGRKRGPRTRGRPWRVPRSRRRTRGPGGDGCFPARRIRGCAARASRVPPPDRRDRKSTRLNSSHLVISYAVFCLKKTDSCFASA